ncbi:fluoride efflux transporter CrcB [Paraferrimonas sedimenticola]|uniref:Fluoride-specific ion channel FluC n=1 Tax=Paraferrimonas sedimenticola TaxID=375674 RepID=A0AA37RWC0_9GAMM|nr:fluoride efflux transporter CrcB [Paraferrimonas sedimenticola]GLP96544.1 putative fluoride ion transporter CrcB [Paraferrimonas sedimenticola]
MNMASFGWVALGGALGACSRYAIAEICLLLFGRGFPIATLTVNVVGSLGIGFLVALVEQEVLLHAAWRQVVIIGFLGAFTTFSTFSMDNLLLLQQQEYLKAAVNMFANLSLCMLAVAIGFFWLPKLVV